MYHSLIVRPVIVILRSILITVCLVGGAIAAGPLPADPVPFDIGQQPLRLALTEFARQSDRELLFSTEVVEDKVANHVDGTYEPEDALELLLTDTGLEYSVTANDTILVAEEGGGPNQGKGNARAKPILMAQNQTPAQTQPDSTKSEDDEEDRLELERIVVTGTHIRGTHAAVGSKLTTLDRSDIEIGGFGNTQEVIQSLPSVFTGGIGEFTRNSENDANFGGALGGTSINLRGLGVGQTLILVNGRRLAPSGLRGSFVDVSKIPASLIDRVEVLSDGASATYGTDAVAGVVNVILRDDFDGAETSLRFGTVTEGGSQEYRASQTFGGVWETGHAMIAYEYYKREKLGYEERAFTADSDLTSLGGDNFRTPFSVPGNIVSVTLADGTRVSGQWAIPDGQDGTSLTSGDLLSGQVNFFNENPARALLVDQERHSVLVAASQELGEKFELFAEGRFDERDLESGLPISGITLSVPSTNPFFVDPFGGAASIVMRYNFLKDLGEATLPGKIRAYNAVLGARAEIWGDWQVQAYSLYSREGLEIMSRSFDRANLAAALADPDPATAFNPFGDGTFQQNPDTLSAIIFPVPRTGHADVWTGKIVADGSLFDLPGGPVKLAAGASYDKYSFVRFEDFGGGDVSESALERDVTALFGEVQVPLFDADNRRPGLERLIISASGRYEDYSDAGDTANPKVGLLWSPIDGLDIRGTWGTSFRAPDLVELDESNNFLFHLFLPDPSSPTGTTLVLLFGGNNSDLKNETAETSTVGFDYSPPSAPEFSFGLTYYKIDFSDRITNFDPGDESIVFSEEDRFSSVLTRNPPQQLVDEICNSGAQFFDVGLGDCFTAPIGAILDERRINTAKLKTDGIDFNVRYGFDTDRSGRFDLGLSATYILSFKDGFGPTAPLIEFVDTVSNPIDLRLRSSVSWTGRNGLSAAAFVNYSDSYTDNRSDPERKIDSWTTVDLTVAYHTGDRMDNSWLNGVRLALSARNLFDTDPPFVNNRTGIVGAVGFDPENASPLGRFISFNITKKW